MRQKTPNEIALNILLASLTIVFLLVVIALQPMSDFAGSPQSIVILVALLVCLIPTTIGALVSAIGVAGMDRLVQHNVLAMSGRAVEAAGDVSTLLLDKTGTITYGNRQAARLVAGPRRRPGRDGVRDAGRQPGRRDPGREVDRRAVPRRVPRRPALGRRGRAGRRGHRVLRPHPDERHRPARRRSGRRRHLRSIRKGAVSQVAQWVDRQRRHGAAGVAGGRGRDLRRRRHPAAGRRGRPGAGRRAPQGRRQTGYRGTVRRPAGDGHPDGDDHRRHRAHRAEHRQGGRRRRLPRRGHPGGQARLHPQASRRAAGSSR